MTAAFIVVAVGAIAGVTTALAGAAALLVGRAVAGRVRAWRRGQHFERAMPILLDEMARGVRAGLSPTVALTDAADRSGPPFPAALRPASDRLALGASIEEALDGWRTESSSPSVALLAESITTGRAVGVVTARSIDAIAETLRERQSIRSTIAVHVAQAQVSAVVMAVAPLVFCTLLVAGNAPAAQLLLRTPLGWVCLSVGLGLDGLGTWWMLRTAAAAQR